MGECSDVLRGTPARSEGREQCATGVLLDDQGSGRAQRYTGDGDAYPCCSCGRVN